MVERSPKSTLPFVLAFFVLALSARGETPPPPPPKAAVADSIPRAQATRVLPPIAPVNSVAPSPTTANTPSAPRLAANSTPAAPAAPAPTASDTSSRSDHEESGSEEEAGANGPRITAERLETALKEAQESTEFAADLKAKIVEEYKKALEQTKAFADEAERAEGFEKTIADAPARLEKRRAWITRPFKEFALDPKTQPLSELEKALDAEVEKLERAEKKAEDLANEPKRRDDRRRELAELVQAARDRRQKLREELAAKTPEDEPPALTAARHAHLTARLDALDQQIRAHRAELAMFDATREVLPIDRDLSIRTVTRYQQRIEIAKSAVNARRRLDAEAQALEAQAAAKNAANLSPIAREIAEANASLAARRRPLAEKIGAASTRLAQITPQLAKLSSRSKLIRDKVDTGGLTEETGLLLRGQQREMPDRSEHSRELLRSREALIRTQLELIDLEAERHALVDVAPRVEQIALGLDPSVYTMGIDHVRDSITKLLEMQRVFVDSLIADSETYAETLSELIEAEEQLLAETEDFSEYIAERILWVRSGGPIDRGDFHSALAALEWLVAPSSWLELTRAVWGDIVHNPLAYVGVTLGLAFLLLLQRRARKTIKRYGELTRKNYTGTSSLTLATLVLTMLVSCLWPGLLALAGWRIAHVGAQHSPFTRAVGASLPLVCVIYFGIEVLRQVCRNHGLADAHFRWRAKSLVILRRNLYWLLVTEIPLAFTVAMMEASGNSAWSHSLGRFAFILGLLVLAQFTRRMLNPKDGVLVDLLANLQGGWMDRVQAVLYPFAVVAPLALAVAAGLGYFYTAEKTAERLLATVLLAGALVLFNALTLRWLFAARGKLAMEQARKRRAAEREASTENVPSDANTVPDNDEVDLSKINLQTRTLLRSAVGFAFALGMWLIWSDIMPALKIFENVTLWQNTVSVAQNVEGPAGTTQVKMVEQMQPVDLADAIRAAVVALMTVIAAKNIPGLLEITILARLPLDAGGRYASAKLSSYLITILGLALSARQIGVGWSNVQWLAAAVSVGLGFGLQEIFANFVSGLILLFERPIRVGDLITVSEKSGVVTKIRIRATTLTDFDKKELVIPNKAFITDQITNWTLSDRMIRLVFQVGVAYGSDTVLTRELLLAAAKQHPKVLSDPPPSAIFDSFGDSTLNFVLRAYIANLDDSSVTRHEINTTIDNLLREHGIEIAYPQREVHLKEPTRSLGVHHDSAAPAPSSASPGSGTIAKSA